jgi:phosphohistidine phosphatase
MNLYIIRHAWAGQYGDPRWPDDTQRPLTDYGKTRFADMVDLLVERGVEPTVIATSPMLRCRQTGEILAAAMDGRAELLEQKELLPDGDFEKLWAWTCERAKEHERIAWVGHRPQVNEYVERLVGLPADAIRFAKGAVVAIRFGEELALRRGELQWLATAKLLGV